MKFIKHFFLKICYIIDYEIKRTDEELAFFEEYFSEQVCGECNDIRQEHSVCKVCKR